MFEQDTITHHIQRSILGALMTREFARFRDLKPENVDTNLFSYHLKLLQRDKYVRKTDSGYTLAEKGLQHVDRVNVDRMRLRTQPKIITMLLIQDGYGKILLQKRQKQPYINTWTLPYGKIHIADESVQAAAQREARDKLGFDAHKVRHVGDCYILTGNYTAVDAQSYAAGKFSDGDTLHITHDKIWVVDSRTLAHIVRFETDAIAASETLIWVDPLDLASHRLAPAVEQIVSRAFFNDNFFFEEFKATDQITLPLYAV
ncbi:MAG: NUDIX hydrolase [Candidatus Saccharimonas sp.]|nr:NUDIX hydrolase [Candidatus Saccharimonas sp.]